MKHFIGIIFAALLATSASAATMSSDEASTENGDFSDNPDKASAFGSDIVYVTGAQNKQNDVDFLTFSGFANGTLSLDFVFTHEDGQSGKLDFVLQREEFKNKNAWPDSYHNPGYYTETISGLDNDSSHKVSYVLDGYTGPIYIALRFYDSDAFYGQNKRDVGVTYAASSFAGASGVSAPAPVPLPAALPLALVGIGALIVLRARRRVS